MDSSIENAPLALPPPGVEANFEDPESRASWIYITAAICLSLMIVFASIRLYAKLYLIKARTWDDFACATGFIAGCAYICITVTVVSLGAYGHHIWDFTISGLSLGLIRLGLTSIQLTLVNEVTYGPFIWFIKLTLFLLFLELFGKLRWLRWLVWTGIVVSGLFYLSTMIVYIELCAPHGGQSQLDYLSAISAPKCEDQRLSVAMGAFNILSDFYILCIPFPAVWSLQMPRRRKVGVSAIFLTGIAACISSILGLAYRLKLSESIDNTWTVIPLWVVTTIEITSGFLVSCMPSVAATYRHVRPRIATFLGSYQQRLLGYGSFGEGYELHEASDKSKTRSQRNASGIKAPSSAKSQGQKDWEVPKVDIGERDFDAGVQRAEHLGIHKMTQVKVAQGPRLTTDRTEVWGMPGGGMV